MDVKRGPLLPGKNYAPPEHHAMKAYWEVEVQLHISFDLSTRRRWVVSFTPRM